MGLCPSNLSHYRHNQFYTLLGECVRVSTVQMLSTKIGETIMMIDVTCAAKKMPKFKHGMYKHVFIAQAFFFHKSTHQRFKEKLTRDIHL